jgi:sialic acid synthase SpsE
MIQIIAELAQGFEGKYEQARLLVKAGSVAGADAVKMQLVFADELCTPDYKDFALFKTLEMSNQDWANLARYSKSLKVEFHVDIFGPRSLSLAEDIGCQAVKIHGTDMGNYGLLKRVAQSSIPKVLLGAGGGFREEISNATEILSEKKITILLGFQGYPTANDANQVDRVRALSRQFDQHNNIQIGFADHANPNDPLSLAIPAMAMGAGAVVFEKHLTLSQIMRLEDYEAALNPDQFSVFSKGLRACYFALGCTGPASDYGMTESELAYRKWTRKHVVTTKQLQPGEAISAEAVTLKRTPSIDAYINLELVYGKRPVKIIDIGESISPADLGE